MVVNIIDSSLNIWWNLYCTAMELTQSGLMGELVLEINRSNTLRDKDNVAALKRVNHAIP
ncbi:hypothetical protein ACFL3A_00190 [Pseudomonadota bacterium]